MSSYYFIQGKIDLLKVKQLFGTKCTAGFSLKLPSNQNLILIQIDDEEIEDIKNFISSDPDSSSEIKKCDDNFISSDYTSKQIYICTCTLDSKFKLPDLVSSFFVGGWEIYNTPFKFCSKVCASTTADLERLAIVLKKVGCQFYPSLDTFPLIQVDNFPLNFNEQVFDQFNSEVLHSQITKTKFFTQEDTNILSAYLLFQSYKYAKDSYRMLNGSSIGNFRLNSTFISDNSFRDHEIFNTIQDLQTDINTNQSSNQSFSNQVPTFNQSLPQQSQLFTNQNPIFNQSMPQQSQLFTNQNPIFNQPMPQQSQLYSNSNQMPYQPIPQPSVNPQPSTNQIPIQNQPPPQNMQTNTNQQFTNPTNPPQKSTSDKEKVFIFPSSILRTIIVSQPTYIAKEILEKDLCKYGQIDQVIFLNSNDGIATYKVIYRKEGSCSTLLNSKQYKSSATKMDYHVSTVPTSPVYQLFPKDPNPKLHSNLCDETFNTVVIAFDADSDLSEIIKQIDRFGVYKQILYQKYNDRIEVAVTFDQIGSAQTLLNCNDYKCSARMSKDLKPYRGNHVFQPQSNMPQSNPNARKNNLSQSNPSAYSLNEG